jgi:NADPH:quinone reductase
MDGLPSQMQAFVCGTLTDDLAGTGLQLLPVPVAGPGQLLIKVAACGINYPDVLMCQGRYQFKPEPPFIPGMEVAGTIAACGAGVSDYAIGDAVMAGARLGGLAEFVAVDAAAITPKPRNFDMAEAAGFSTAALTAWVSLVCRGQLMAGEVLLVHGAAGGVGMAAVDLGLHLGATVIAVASSQEKRAVLQARGAHHVIDPADGFRAQVKALTRGRGADVIFDPVGGDVFDESCRCIAFDGRLLVVGFAGGRIATLASNMALIKGFSVVGVRAGEYGRQFPDRGRANHDAIMKLAEEGVMTPHIGARFSLYKALDGLKLLLDRGSIGKTVVEV